MDRQKIEADWLEFLERMQPAFDSLVNVLPVLARANAHKRIEQAEQRQRHLATQLSDKKAMHVKLVEAKLRGELNQQDFEAMRDVLAKDIAEIESAHRGMIQEAEAALLLTSDTTRTTIPAKALWASAQLTDKLTVQSALFPEGILYRSDIGFFEPPDDRLSALVFTLLIELAEHPEAYEEEEIISGRGEWI